ncbi:TetR family transcriptional regulator OS=Streptomyces fumanus OX=67302 GN=GCM10018772_71190 PE=4 SV=1 [Streptomyces fumanus]
MCRAITAGIRSPGFRGCAFLNAAAEYPDPEHPVHQAPRLTGSGSSRRSRSCWPETGSAPAGPAGRHLVMLRDGAMASRSPPLDPRLVCEMFLQGVEGILQARAA